MIFQYNWLSPSRMVFIVFIALIGLGPVVAQNQLVISTLENARAKIDQKKLEEAVLILAAFENQYPGDIYVERLYAQTLSWLLEYERSEEVYQKALGFHPNNSDLKFEYAIMLIDYGKYELAEEQLIDVLKEDSDHGNILVLLGKINYFQGKYKKAAAYLSKALLLKPENDEVESLSQTVHHILSPQLTFDLMYREDQQELIVFGPQLSFKWYLSRIFELGLKTQLNKYSGLFYNNNDGNILSSLEVFNRFHFQKVGFSAQLSAGVARSRIGSSKEFCGGVHLSQKLYKSLQVDFVACRKNYDYTLLSAQQLLMISQYKMSLSQGKENGFNGLAGLQYSFFPDDNYVYAYYLWFLTKPVKLSKLNISFGYAFNHMNSKGDRYEALETIRPNYQGNSSKIEGIYNAYYTPMDLWSNSVLLKMEYSWNKNVKVKGHASVGLISSIDAPYLYYDFNSVGIIEIFKGFSQESYIPYDFGFHLQSYLSKNLEFQLSYSYLSTYFFATHLANISMKMYF